MSKKLALIIEDNRDTAEIFEAALTNGGFETEVIFDGQEAIARLDQSWPTLILLDLHLPSLSGDKILDYIIDTPRFNETRVIIASADGHLANYQDLKGKEKLMILQKPVSYDQLMRMAQRLTHDA